MMWILSSTRVSLSESGHRLRAFRQTHCFRNPRANSAIDDSSKRLHAAPNRDIGISQSHDGIAVVVKRVEDHR